MVLEDIQAYIIESIPELLEKVDLLRLRNVKNPNNIGPIKLIIDAECCLDRLYGGFYPDWVSGGMWKQMQHYLDNLLTSVRSNLSNVELIFFFNGSFESERLSTNWLKKQQLAHQNLQEIHRHISTKNKPPPKCWWIPPTFLQSALRITLRSLHGKIMCSLDDHHKEIVKLSQKEHFIGIVSDDPEFIVWNPERFFSAHKIKLTFKGSLETNEIKLKKLYEMWNLPKERLPIFATLLGNHILSESDLAGFIESLDIESQNATSKKPVIDKIAQFTRDLDSIDPEHVGVIIAKHEFEKDREKARILQEKVIACIKYYSELNIKNPSRSNSKKSKSKGNQQKRKEKSDIKDKDNSMTKAATKDENTPETTQQQTTDQNTSTETKAEVSINNNGNASSSSSEITTTTTAKKENSETIAAEGASGSSTEKMAYKVNNQIENITITRHKNGFMSPYIYQIFRHREIKLPVIIEAYYDKDLPKSHDLYRPLRANVYAILFNLHHLRFLSTKNKEKTPTIQVKETYFCAQDKSNKTLFVEAVELGWGVPTVERLWLGDGDECKQKRIRAFLSIMNSDRKVILDTTFIPQQMLVLAVVLRYMLSHGKFIRKYEMDAFIAQGFMQELTEPTTAQEIELKSLTMRGVHLANVFMQGVEMASLSNDATGSPLPFNLFCPWNFFNGKIFNYIMERQVLGKTLTEICNFKMDLVYKIDSFRLAILDGIKPQFAPSPSPFLFSNGGLLAQQQETRQQIRPIPSQYSRLDAFDLCNSPLGNPIMSSGNLISRAGSRGINNARASGFPVQNINTQQFSPYNNNQMLNASRNNGFGFNNNPMNFVGPRKVQSPRDTRGGHLEVAGQIVGSWGANANYRDFPHFSGYSPYAAAAMQQHNGSGFGIRNNNYAHMNSLFNQMNISGSRPNNYHNKKSSGKIQQKKSNKKNDASNKTNSGKGGSKVVSKVENGGAPSVSGTSPDSKAENSVENGIVSTTATSTDINSSPNPAEADLSGDQIKIEN